MSAPKCSIKVGDTVHAVWDEPSPGDCGPATVTKVYWVPNSGWWIKTDDGSRFSQECVVECERDGKVIA